MARRWLDAATNVIVITLLLIAACFGFVGWLIHPTFGSPPVPEHASFYILVRVPTKDYKLPDTIASQVTLERVGLDQEVADITALIADNDILRHLEWYLFVSLPPGAALLPDANFNEVAISPVCDIKEYDKSIFGPLPDLHIFKPNIPTEYVDTNNLVNPAKLAWSLTFRWPDSQRVIASRGSRFTFVTPEINAMTVDPDTHDCGGLAVPSTAESAFGPADDLAIDSGQSPSTQKFNYWTWHDTSLFHSVVINAHSVTEQDAEHGYDFLSGVLFGLAGGAAIASCQEFLNRALGHKERDRSAAASNTKDADS